MPKDTVGLVLVFTGDGKGKTTAALGTALRAWGQGMHVLFLQFIKGSWPTGEQNAVLKLGDRFEFLQVGEGFIDFSNAESLEQQKKTAAKGLEIARQGIASNKYQLIVLDEINYALSYGLVKINDVLNLIEKKPKQLHLILTGRNAPEEIINAADLVTNMEAVKHPYNAGIPAQKGIEF